jgi:cytochrome c heme-lyase
MTGTLFNNEEGRYTSVVLVAIRSRYESRATLCARVDDWLALSITRYRERSYYIAVKPGRVIMNQSTTTTTTTTTTASSEQAQHAAASSLATLGGGCPVDHSSLNSSKTASTQPQASALLSLASWWGSSNAASSASSAATSSSGTTTSLRVGIGTASASSCPVGKEGGANIVDATPASLEEAANHAQTPLPDQTWPLRTDRQVSSIPRGDVPLGAGPHHQPTAATTPRWVYPSEQQLYNAMRRKGWQNIPEDSISAVLHIHNNINEGTWRKIQDWEGSEATLKLAKFQGRPGTLTPKAFLLTKVLRLYDPPFDRHDWYVENAATGRQQRYVIDYYSPTAAQAAVAPANHKSMAAPPQAELAEVDVRPALDDGRAVFMRGQRALQDAFPGFSAYYKRRLRMQKEHDQSKNSQQ